MPGSDVAWPPWPRAPGFQWPGAPLGHRSAAPCWGCRRLSDASVVITATKPVGNPSTSFAARTGRPSGQVAFGSRALGGLRTHDFLPQVEPSSGSFGASCCGSAGCGGRPSDFRARQSVRQGRGASEPATGPPRGRSCRSPTPPQQGTRVGTRANRAPARHLVEDAVAPRTRLRGNLGGSHSQIAKGLAVGEGSRLAYLADARQWCETRAGGSMQPPATTTKGRLSQPLLPAGLRIAAVARADHSPGNRIFSTRPISKVGGRRALMRSRCSASAETNSGMAIVESQ